MYCGGNQLIDTGSLSADRVTGTVVDLAGTAVPGAKIQVQVQGSEKILREIRATEQGTFRLPKLRPGVYWLGISSLGFNLHYWELRIVRREGPKAIRVELSLGT